MHSPINLHITVLNWLLICTFFFFFCRVISILTVFVNKALLSSQTLSLDAPLFVTWYQCVVSAAICFMLSMLTKLFPHTFTFPEGSPFSCSVAVKVCRHIFIVSHCHYLAGVLRLCVHTIVISGASSVSTVHRNHSIQQFIPQVCRCCLLLYRTLLNNSF
jgi:hypothetical protein